MIDERIKMIKAMEYIARQLNDEHDFEYWQFEGVGGEDVDYGDMSVGADDAENLDVYLPDEYFADLMNTFLLVMARAKKSGGLFCDGVVSKKLVEKG